DAIGLGAAGEVPAHRRVVLAIEGAERGFSVIHHPGDVRTRPFVTYAHARDCDAARANRVLRGPRGRLGGGVQAPPPRRGAADLPRASWAHRLGADFGGAG